MDYVPKLSCKFFSHFNLRKFDIICLQKTFWDDNFIKSYVKYQWDGEIYYSNSDELHYSKEVAILFRHNIDCDILFPNRFSKGRAFEVIIEFDDHVFTIVDE